MTTITESVLAVRYAVDQHGNPKTCTRKVLPPEKKCWQHKDLNGVPVPTGPKAGGALVSDLQHQAEALAVNEDADDEISGALCRRGRPRDEYNLDVLTLTL